MLIHAISDAVIHAMSFQFLFEYLSFIEDFLALAWLCRDGGEILCIEPNIVLIQGDT